MRSKLCFALLFLLPAGRLSAKVSPGGKPVGIGHKVNIFQPYITVLLIELGILLILAILILIKVQRIRRSNYH